MKQIIKPFLSVALLLGSIAPLVAQSQPSRQVNRDELRVCMNSESELATRRTALAERAQKRKSDDAALKAESDELTEEKTRAGDDSRRIDRFERRARAFNLKVEAAKAAGDAFRGELESLNKALIAHNDTCGGISYKAEDKEAILKEPEAAKK